MKKHLFFIVLFALALFTQGCSDENGNSSSGQFNEGVYILNEGQFGAGNGSIIYIDTDSTYTDIFQTVNNRPLGDVVQNMTIHNGLAYIVVNNSNKVEVVDANTFEEVATITGLAFPRDFIGISDTKGYVSQWGDGFTGSVEIVDLTSFTVTGSIPTGGNGADKMITVNDKIYVGHSGGYGFDDRITVIDPFTDQITSTLNIGLNSNDMVFDNQGRLWVLSAGRADYSTTPATIFNGSLVCMDVNDNSIIHDFDLGTGGGFGIADLCKNSDGTKLYFLQNSSEIIEQDVNAGTLSANIIHSNPNFSLYSLGYDTNENKIYIGDAGDFSSPGTVTVLDASGAVLNSFSAGVVPTEFVVR